MGVKFNVVNKTKMNKKSIYDVTKQGYQYCSHCKKDTWHTPKLGLVFSNKRLCSECRTSNELIQKRDESNK